MKKSTAQLLYEPLLSDHVKTVLESGLLLDEDYEVLLKSFNFETFSVEPYKPPMRLIVCGATTAASVVLAKRINFKLLPVVPLAATATYFYLEIRSFYRRQKQRAAVKRMIDGFIKLHKLITGIISYQKTRNEVVTKKAEKSTFLSSVNVEKFISYFAERFTDLLYYILSELQFLSSFVESLYVDFEELRELDISRLLDADNLVNESLRLSMKVKDLYCLLMSKFLNYLGVAFCKNLSDICVKEVDCLLNSTLPKLTARLVETYSDISIEFNRLRYNVSEKLSFRNRTPVKKHISGKLQQTLAGSINNLSIILEETGTVLEKVDRLEDKDNLDTFQKAVAELRDHAFATYESLDILCKLYGILSKSECNATNRIEVAKENSDSSANVQQFNFDDVSDALEENYELYVDKDVTSNEDEQGTYDQPGAYLGLMLRELGHCLKQHERFVAARNKRGIKEDEEEQFGYRKMKKSPPKFDLMLVQSSSSDQQIPLPSTVSRPPPPPAPPPLPSLNLTEVPQNADQVSGSTHSLLTSLKALSHQLQTREDVFGGNDTDKSCSDSD